MTVVDDPGLKKHSLVPKGASPEICSVCFGDAEVVALEEAVGEDGLQLGQHVTEDQRQLGQVASEERERNMISVWELWREQGSETGDYAPHPKTSIWTLHALAKTSLVKDTEFIHNRIFTQIVFFKGLVIYHIQIYRLNKICILPNNLRVHHQVQNDISINIDKIIFWMSL